MEINADEKLGIVLNAFRWIGNEEALTMGHQSLNCLDIFPLCLVVKNVGDILRENLLSTSTGVNAHHRHTDGPRAVSNGHLQVRVVCLQRNV